MVLYRRGHLVPLDGSLEMITSKRDVIGLWHIGYHSTGKMLPSFIFHFVVFSKIVLCLQYRNGAHTFQSASAWFCMDSYGSVWLCMFFL